MDYIPDTEDEVVEITEDGDEEGGSSGRRRKRRILRHTAVLPSVFTLLNGMCGLGAIHFATKTALGSNAPEAIDHFWFASVLIFAAMVCDMLDGRLARMTRTTTDFGAQLDSLCDVVSFGVAPAMLVLRCTVSILRSVFTLPDVPVERALWCIAGVYVSCAVLRLARFNVESDHAEESHMTFRGLPSPGAAACLSSLMLLYVNLICEAGQWSWLSLELIQYTMAVALPMFMLLCALLMVSRFKYQHLANQYFRGTAPFGYLVKLVFLLFLLIPAFIEPYCFVAVIFLGYTFSGPVGSLLRLLKRT